MSAPWTAPTADSPAAVGLKNGGLREITTDIIYPVSRAEKGSFQSGVGCSSTAVGLLSDLLL
jgi:hypothetical protein